MTAGIAVGVDVLYLLMKWGERDDYLDAPPIFHDALREMTGNPFTPNVIFWSAAILALAAAAVLGRAWYERRIGVGLVWGAAVGLVGLGILGMWSIGIPLLIASGFAISSAVVCTTTRPSKEGTTVAVVLGVTVTLAVLATGVALTW